MTDTDNVVIFPIIPRPAPDLRGRLSRGQAILDCFKAVMEERDRSLSELERAALERGCQAIFRVAKPMIEAVEHGGAA